MGIQYSFGTWIYQESSVASTSTFYRGIRYVIHLTQGKLLPPKRITVMHIIVQQFPPLSSDTIKNKVHCNTNVI